MDPDILFRYLPEDMHLWGISENRPDLNYCKISTVLLDPGNHLSQHWQVRLSGSKRIGSKKIKLKYRCWITLDWLTNKRIQRYTLHREQVLVLTELVLSETQCELSLLAFTNSQFHYLPKVLYRYWNKGASMPFNEELNEEKIIMKEKGAKI